MHTHIFIPTYYSTKPEKKTKTADELYNKPWLF